MKNFRILLTLIAVPMIMSSALSQEAGPTNTLRCETTDGTIVMKGNTVQLRDYNMKVETIEREGVIRLVDMNSEATAVLDTRDPEGLYFAISEGDVQMQVVVSKSSMKFSGEVASADESKFDMVNTIHSTYRPATLTAIAD